jgi:hypothetical protein
VGDLLTPGNGCGWIGGTPDWSTSSGVRVCWRRSTAARRPW